MVDPEIMEWGRDPAKLLTEVTRIENELTDLLREWGQISETTDYNLRHTHSGMSDPPTVQDVTEQWDSWAARFGAHLRAIANTVKASLANAESSLPFNADVLRRLGRAIESFVHRKSDDNYEKLQEAAIEFDSERGALLCFVDMATRSIAQTDSLTAVSPGDDGPAKPVPPKPAFASPTDPVPNAYCDEHGEIGPLVGTATALLDAVSPAKRKTRKQLLKRHVDEVDFVRELHARKFEMFFRQRSAFSKAKKKMETNSG
jgi:hypothetical protein